VDRALGPLRGHARRVQPAVVTVSVDTVPRSTSRQECPTVTIDSAFSGFSVDDIPAAQRFYGDTLGLTVDVLSVIADVRG